MRRFQASVGELRGDAVDGPIPRDKTQTSAALSVAFSF
jgi:outer membrane scaffolding protein for murein synthesis (MipA/OmpV family)